MTYSPKTSKNLEPVTNVPPDEPQHAPWPGAVKETWIDREGRVHWEYDVSADDGR